MHRCFHADYIICCLLFLFTYISLWTLVYDKVIILLFVLVHVGLLYVCACVYVSVRVYVCVGRVYVYVSRILGQEIILSLQ